MRHPSFEKMTKHFLLLLLVYVLNSCGQSDPAPENVWRQEATATIYSLNKLDDNRYELTDHKIGTATLSQANSVVTLEIRLENMPPHSSKAAHIHSGTVNEPGRHWNQGSFYSFCNERSLGQLWARPFAGDIGNVPIDENGNGLLVVSADLWALNSGDEKDILGRTIIIHQNSENFAVECHPGYSHSRRHANPKIGGGAIELSDGTKGSPK